MYDDLLMFVKLVTIGSFSQTAKYYATSQPTITRRIQALEAELGIQLIKRNTRNLEVTFSGQKLYDRLQHFKTSIDNILQEIKSTEGSTNSRLRIALPPSISFYVISPYLGEFMAQNPQLSLDIIFQRSAVDIVTQKLDLAVNANLPTSQGVKIKLLHKAYFQLYASGEYIARYGLPKNMAELKNHTVIGMINSDNSIDKILYAQNKHSDEKAALNNSACRMLSNEGLNTHQIVRSGYAIGGLWDTLINDEQVNSDLVLVLPEYLFSEIPYYLIRDPENKSPSLEVVIKFIESCFQRLQGAKLAG